MQNNLPLSSRMGKPWLWLSMSSMKRTFQSFQSLVHCYYARSGLLTARFWLLWMFSLGFLFHELCLFLTPLQLTGGELLITPSTSQRSALLTGAGTRVQALIITRPCTTQSPWGLSSPQGTWASTTWLCASLPLPSPSFWTSPACAWWAATSAKQRRPSMSSSGRRGQRSCRKLSRSPSASPSSHLPKRSSWPKSLSLRPWSLLGTSKSSPGAFPCRRWSSTAGRSWRRSSRPCGWRIPTRWARRTSSPPAAGPRPRCSPAARRWSAAIPRPGTRTMAPWASRARRSPCRCPSTPSATGRASTPCPTAAATLCLLRKAPAEPAHPHRGEGSSGEPRVLGEKGLPTSCLSPMCTSFPNC